MTSKQETATLADFPNIGIEELEQLAGIGYSLEKIALYYGIDEELFLFAYQIPGSILRYHIERGILLHEAKEAIATQSAAEAGNATQAQRLDKRRFSILFERLKEKYIYGKEV